MGSGEARRFGPGDALLAEDTRGRGHCTRSLDRAGRWSIFIALGDGGRWGWLWARPTTREVVLAVLMMIAAVVFACTRASRASRRQLEVERDEACKNEAAMRDERDTLRAELEGVSDELRGWWPGAVDSVR